MAKKRYCPEPTEKQLSKFIEELDAWEMVTHALTTTGSAVEDELAAVLANANDEKLKEILRRAREGEPFLLSYFACVPEVLVAMDLAWYTSVASAFVGSLLPGHSNRGFNWR